MSSLWADQPHPFPEHEYLATAYASYETVAGVDVVWACELPRNDGYENCLAIGSLRADPAKTAVFTHSRPRDRRRGSSVSIGHAVTTSTARAAMALYFQLSQCVMPHSLLRAQESLPLEELRYRLRVMRAWRRAHAAVAA